MSKIPATGIQHGSIDCDGTCGPTRRSFMKTGAVSFLGLSLMDMMRASAFAANSEVSKCDSVILIWLAGGPSHIDTFDPKPGQATAGQFKPINTSATGIQLCEHMPTIAKNMNQMSLVRSMTSKEGSHERATYEMHTGYKPLASIAHPSIGSLVVQQRGKRNEDIPGYVAIGGAGQNQSAFGAGFLGSQVAPFFVADANNASRNLNFPKGTDDDRFKRRFDIKNELDKEFSTRYSNETVSDYGTYYRDAVHMMYSKSVEAFDLSKEKAATLKAYGETGIGRAALMARRLVENGVRFVELGMGGWDTHADGATAIEKNLNSLDPAVGNLVEDLNARGMLKRTLIICTGEFGRTPKINERGGRDHYPKCFSALLAGGGLKGGYVYGSSDTTGAEVKDNPCSIGDLHATMCEAMGIDYTKENMSPQGRPIRVVDKGKAVKELFA